MLGRFAADLSKARGYQPISTQADAEEAAKQGEKLWEVMVEMTKSAQRVEPRRGKEGEGEKRLLDVKYRIFRESVEVQRRWRGWIAEVA